MAASKTKEYEASVLSFERQLEPSDSVFSSGSWDNRHQHEQWPGVAVREKAIRGTIANRRKNPSASSDSAKLEAEVDVPNIQTVDFAALPQDDDTLKASFTLKILGGVAIPAACNNPLHQARVGEIAAGYIAEDGFRTLAQRYAYNIASGRWLWRNRMKAEDLEVHVSVLRQGAEQGAMVFSGLTMPLGEFPASVDDQLALLADHIAAALRGETVCFLRVVAFARVGEGQEVFPSQEMVMSPERTKKSKWLFTAEGNTAGQHSQKIGNALRTVDTWYPEALEGEGVGPIAAEPFGAVTSRGVAYRRPKEKKDFYSLYDRWIERGEVPDSEQQHFVMSVLLRGGVFGKSGKE